MKITFIIQNITRAAGTEKATIHLAHSFTAKGIDTQIISINSTPETAPFFRIEERIRIYHLGAKYRLAALFKIKNILKKTQPTYIFGTGHNISFFLPFLAPRGGKTVALEHIDYNSIPRFSKNLIKISYPKLDAVVSLTLSAQQKLEGVNKKVVTIPNRVSKSTEISTLSKKRIILVGRISWEKAYERVIPIAEKMQIAYPDWSIDVFGEDNGYRSTLEDMLQSKNLSNVQINPPTRNIEKEYLDSSIFMITSIFEAFGLVILEAKSFGLPVVGFRNEGTQTLIEDGHDGFIVENEEDAFEKLSLLINDYQLRKSMGKRGLVNMMQFSEEKVTRQWLDFLASF